MVTAKQGHISNAPRLCNPHGVASLHFSKVAEPAILNRLKSGKSVVSQTALAYSSVGAMSASLIGHLRSSTFRLSTTAVSMSLRGSRFSSEWAPRPFHYGIRGRGGTIFGSALPLH